MVQNMTQIACPNCRTPLQLHLKQLLDVSVDPGAKSRLLSGSLNHAHCPTCGFDGMISTPLVYHDPNHELLLTYVPVEVNLPKDEQERVIGQMINRVVDRLPAEDRKAYLLQPQAVLTMQGLVERILEADGITQEEIDAQREKIRLFEDLLRQPEDQLKPFVQDHDEEMDAAFFQLATLAIQSTQDQKSQEMLTARLNQAMEFSSFGQQLIQQEQEVQAAIESLQSEGSELSRERILSLMMDAPSEARVSALVSLTRPALDYTFFQLLTEKIEQADGEEKERLSELREQVLALTEEIDRLQEARAAERGALLEALVNAENTSEAVSQALPYVDELFMGTLEANLQAARDRNDEELLSKLMAVQEEILKQLQEAMPANLKFLQELIEMEDSEAAVALIQENNELIDDSLLNALLSAVQQLESAGRDSDAERVHGYYREALKASMQAKMNPKSVE